MPDSQKCSIHQVLRDAILQGLLRPTQHLATSDLADMFGVSRTPLREALFRLAGEGLVEIDHGFYVKGLTCDQLRDLLVYGNGLLEHAIFLGAKQQIQDPAIEQLLARLNTNDGGEGQDWAETIEDLYISIAKSTNNSDIMTAIGYFSAKSHIFRADLSNRVEFKSVALSSTEKAMPHIHENVHGGLATLVNDMFKWKIDNADLIWRSSAYRLIEPDRDLSYLRNKIIN